MIGGSGNRTHKRNVNTWLLEHSGIAARYVGAILLISRDCGEISQIVELPRSKALNAQALAISTLASPRARDGIPTNGSTKLVMWRAAAASSRRRVKNFLSSPVWSHSGPRRFYAVGTNSAG